MDTELADDILSVATIVSVDDDSLFPFNLKGREAFSEPYYFDIDCYSDDKNLDPKSYLGSELTFKIISGSLERVIKGVVTTFTQGPSLNQAYGEKTVYRLRLEPHLSLLRYNHEFRVFEDQAVIDIINSVCEENGIPSPVIEANNGGSEPRELCIQYNESDFNFICRLMESEGLFYYFRHSEGATEFVIGDAIDSYVPNDIMPTLSLDENLPTKGEVGIINVCEWRFNTVTGQYFTNDFDFRSPQDPLEANGIYNEDFGMIRYYPGGYVDVNVGQTMVDNKQRIEQINENMIRCESFTPFVMVGNTFELQEHPRDDANMEYVVTAINHDMKVDLFKLDPGHIESAYYKNVFEAMSSEVVASPPIGIKRPIIPGTQTAIVKGSLEDGTEEVYTDDLGRVRILFHWDYRNREEDKSSCWSRFAMPLAGVNWGILTRPRVGHEVVVTFLNGDPDYPLITGSVYNADNMMPYGPDMPTVSTIKTASFEEGGGRNEIYFDDARDMEELRVHASKDLNIVAYSGNLNMVVAASENGDAPIMDPGGGGSEDDQDPESVGAAAAEPEAGVIPEYLDPNNLGVAPEPCSYSLTVVMGDYTTEVMAGNRIIIVQGGDEEHTNGQNFTHTVAGDYTLEITGNLTIQVTGSIDIASEADISISAGGSLNISAEAGIVANAVGPIEISSEAEISQTAGAAFTAEAGAELAISAGGALEVSGGSDTNLSAGGVITMAAPLVELA